MHSLRKVIFSQCLYQNSSRLMHTTSLNSVDSRWRRENKLPPTARREPELYDRPDYSFLNGRPTPISKSIKHRHEDEKRLAEDAIMYIGQIDYALERQEQLKVEAEEDARRILSRKLEPKGPAYKPKHTKDSQ